MISSRIQAQSSILLKKEKKVNKKKTKHKSQLKGKMNDENLEMKAGLSVQMSCNTSNLGKNVNNVRFD